MRKIRLYLPVVDGGRVLFSWYPNPVFFDNSFWVEYPGIHSLESSRGRLAESLFPLCLVFSCLPDTEIELPVELPHDVLSAWRRSIETMAKRCFRRPLTSRLVNGHLKPNYRETAGGRTALFFGGGTESLLVLSKLLDEGVHPVLASFGGPEWSGSNPEKNPAKFEMDEKVSRELGLPLLKVRSNFKQILNVPGWEPYLGRGVSLINAVAFLPFFISFMLPVSEQLGIGRLTNGNEKMNFPDEYFCFSPPMTATYRRLARGVVYEPRLGDLLKEDVCRELYRYYPEIARYQYSCWRNAGERWCCGCESCLEYYALLKRNGRSPFLVGLDESRIRANRRRLLEAAAKSAESRKGEIWERMYEYPELRSDPWMADMMEEIRRKARLYHSLNRFYKAAPEWLKETYRRPRSLLRSAAQKGKRHALVPSGR